MRQTALNKFRDVQSVSVESAKESIIKALAWFDIFHYPLTLEEMRQFMDHKPAGNSFTEALQALIDEGAVYHFHDLNLLQNNSLLVHRRRQGNIRAAKLLQRALKIGRFLQQFPYVRAIGISGSLSKNFASEKADIDFFIITHPRRLWIART